MMNDAVLLQQASGNHVDLLDLQRDYNFRYAKRHQMDYWCVDVALQTVRHPLWDKTLLILAALRSTPKYRWLFWVDSDALISRPDVDLRSALAGDKALGMVIHPGPFHFNAGVIFIQNIPAMHLFFESVWASWPVRNPWEEQMAMIQLLLQSWIAEFEILPAQWNSAHYINPCNHPVIRAWHGVSSVEGRIDEMRAALEEAQRSEKKLVGSGVIVPEDANPAAMEQAYRSIWMGSLATTIRDLTQGRF